MTETELLAEVQRAIDFTDTDDGAMTVVQLSEALDISTEKVRVRLRRLLAEGTIELVKVKRMKMNGVVAGTVAYAKVKNSVDKK